MEAEPGVETERTCSKCAATKPLTDYYKTTKGRRGYMTWCKACHLRDAAARRDKDPEKAKAQSLAWYYRNREHALVLGNVWRDANRERVRERERAREAMPERRAKKAAYRASRSTERKAYNDAYREAHQAERKAYNATYYQANKERVLSRIKEHVARNPDLYRSLHSRWKRQNKDAVNASTHRRRARLKHNGGSWTDKQWQRVKARQNWCCLMCGKQEMVEGIVLCADHIIPLSRGGWNIEANLQALCRSCNSIKYRRVLDLRHTR